jgi:prepilin-type N-terminal cleavage/methylation domain-containing protein
MRQRHTDDQGFSLTEILVTVAIMSVVTMVMVGATIQIYRGTKAIDNTSESRDQLDISFRRLDRELRYAAWTSQTAGQKVGERYYMEYAIPAGCRQLKIENGVLSVADWTLPGTTPGTPVPLVSGVTVVSGVDPFTISPAGTKTYTSASPGTGMGTDYELEFQQVRLRFMVQAGTVALPFDSVFTAQNISRKSTDSDCKYGRPTS